MPNHLADRELFELGPFVLDPAERRLLRADEPIPLEPKVFDTLVALVRSAGHLVSKEDLMRSVWPDSFVEESNLTRNISILRKLLSTAGTQQIETVPRMGYRFVGPVKRVQRQQPAAELPVPPILVNATEREEQPSDGKRRPMTALWAAGAIAACLVAVLFALWRERPELEEVPWKLVRLTADTGVADDPALSNDGRLVAYSSDPVAAVDARSLFEGERDLYVKHVAGGNPIRLTPGGSVNSMPSFSPDGSRIVFRSSRDNGGIYEMPSLGGPARRIAADGFNPRYSPDGSQVAYWVGPRSVSSSVPGSGSVWVVPISGGRPTQVGSMLSTTRYPIWHKDGKHLLVLGYAANKVFDAASIDWWVVAIDGSSAIQTGAYGAMVAAGLQPDASTRTPVPTVPEPRCWSATDDLVTFSIPSGDSWNVWNIELSSDTGRVAGAPRRLTTGGGRDSSVSCSADGALAFANIESHRDIWLIPFDQNRGITKGAPDRMTEGLRSHDSPSLSDNGRFVAYVSDQSGHGNIWQRDIATGKEVRVAASPSVQRYPVSNASGRQIAFSAYEKTRRTLYLSTAGRSAEQLCAECFRATDWSHDEKTLLMFAGDPYEVRSIDVATRRQRLLVSDDNHSVLSGKFSPDDRWISFTVRVNPTQGRIVVAPLGGPTPIPEEAWVPIAEVGPDDYADWSLDGRTLYFTSGRDGHSCLWGQHLDAMTRRPIGSPFVVRHLHGRLSFDHGGWSVAAGRIAIPLLETTGSLWLMSRGTRPS